MKKDEIPYGGEIKYQLKVNADNFSMEDDEFCVILKNVRNGKVISLAKSELFRDIEGNFYVVFNTKELGTGKIHAKVSAEIADEAFADGYRTELKDCELCKIVNV